MKAYSSARDEYTGDTGIFLDANENSLGSTVQGGYNRYPDPHHKALKGRWSQLKGISEDRIFFGNGSDEPIDLIIRLFCEPDHDTIITLPPTYGMYDVSAAINHVKNEKIPLTPAFQIDVKAISKAWNERSKVLFLCSPNNPSGNLLDQKQIRQILDGFPGMVVIDEAYIDFSEDQSWVSALSDHRNLIILQTLSKAWGMAGIRVGVAMGDPYVIAMLEKIKPPYNLSQANQELALSALNNVAVKDEYVKIILKERHLLEKELAAVQIVRSVKPSDTNFLLVEFQGSDAVFDYLIANQVIVRNRSGQLHCQNCLRLTVGKPEENERLLKLLRKF